MNADDGTNQTRLTNSSADDTEPTWSPDGEKMAFISNRDDIESDLNAIYVMNSADGTNQTRVTDNDAAYSSPDWGTATSPPTDDGPTTPPHPEQAINEAISAIQNLDSIPRSLKTNLIALLRQVLDSLNDDTTITTATGEAAAPITQGLSTNTTTAIPSQVPPPLLPFNLP
jgi:hypothetical protein